MTCILASSYAVARDWALLIGVDDWWFGTVPEGKTVRRLVVLGTRR